jgi:CubicO group peptidase (beta-lactamase class C family)
LKKDYLERINSYLSQGIFQSCEYALIRGDKAESYFLSDGAAPVKAGSLWDLASVSKVVGVGTLLIDKIFSSEVDLDAPLQRYYPAWHEPTVTVRELLTHTSGIDPYIANRNQLDATSLAEAMNQLKVNSDRNFKYTDVNFILLGFMLEKMYGQSLDKLFQEKLFKPWQMKQTQFGPVEGAIPTVNGQAAGRVHDPKARVLGIHCGSAGLFSSLSDMVKFVQGYFSDDKYLQLMQDFTKNGSRARSLGWGLLPQDYLIHTGYTGTFVIINLHKKCGVVFLSNRVYYRDERQKWIQERELLIGDFQQYFEND